MNRKQIKSIKNKKVSRVFLFSFILFESKNLSYFLGHDVNFQGDKKKKGDEVIIVLLEQPLDPSDLSRHVTLIAP